MNPAPVASDNNPERPLRRSLNPGALVVSLLLVLYGLYFVLSHRLDSASLMAQTGLIPTDSLNYTLRAEELDGFNLSPIEILTGGLNWISLSAVFAYFQELGDLGPLAFVLINGACLYLWLSGASTLFRLPEPLRSLSPLLSLVALPFLFGWMLAPNKELPTAALLSVILQQAQRDRHGRVLLLSGLAALFKIQILIAALLYLIGLRLRYRRTLALVSLSLVLPLLLPLIGGLTIEGFLEVQENQINSAALFEHLDQINSFPLGYTLVAPLRFTADIFAGLLPSRILSYTQPADLLASFTSFALGTVALLSALKFLTQGGIRNQLRTSSNCSFFVYCVVLAFSLVPYLQVRYYWWAIPLMISYLLHTREWNGVKKFSYANS